MLEEKILNDYKEALKSKDKAKTSILSFLRSGLMNEAIKLKTKSLKDEEVISVVKKMVKQHQDSIEQFKQGGREDLVAKEEQELELLKSYLPEELREAEVLKIIEEVLVELKPSGPKEMGRVMKEVMLKAVNRADGKLVSNLVRQKLSQP
ncbi:MAG: GatB/YqeY domain-containing protein [Candidatus Omnitrophica bacterium]|nr:GatB/YqeY domain-containing protein [Candidatus Omnitrophota bacterium]MBU1872066.1 GatB/YqeY domain-containing protein [Candidatus Omnitrophota bacterium]